MTLRNCYITRAEYVAWVHSTTTSLVVDGPVIDFIIEAASRYCDDKTGRRFYPRVQTRLYDIPDDDTLELMDDLLEITTFTNGDSTVITSANYTLLEANETPYWAVKIKDSSTITWETPTSGSSEQVLSVLGVWGFRPDYDTLGWTAGGTLGAAIADTTTLTATMTAGHTLASGQIWKFGSEIVQGDVSTNTLTFVKRGDNGSTAATHLNGSTVYYWTPYAPIKQAVYSIVNSVYKGRYGQNMTGIAQITAAGVIVTPQDVPQLAQHILSTPPLGRLL